MHTKGTLIAVEGIDGSGKSTLAKRLADHFAQKYPTLLTKEPGASPLGKHIRALVQQQEVHICPKAEYLLFAADRAQHFEEIIVPALNEGKLIISDRMADSSLIYQGYARGLNKEFITGINAWAMQALKPDITLFVQVNPDLARKRLLERNEKLTAFERMDQNFMRKVHEGFCALYKDKNDVILINGEDDPETVMYHAIHALTEQIRLT